MICRKTLDHRPAPAFEAISRPTLRPNLTNRYPPGSKQVKLIKILHTPPRRFQLAIDLRTGLLFGCQNGNGVERTDE